MVFIATLTKNTFAQIGIRAGLNLSKVTIQKEYRANDSYYNTYYKDFDDYNQDWKDYIKNSLGFHIGFVYNIPLIPKISFEPGIFLSKKGFKETEEDSYGGESYEESYYYEYKVNAFYLDIPLMAKATINLGDIDTFAMFGPYFGLGLFGKEYYEEEEIVKSNGRTIEEETYSYSDSRDLNFGTNSESTSWDDWAKFRRLDAGVSFGGGIEFNNLVLSVSYDFGLLNVDGDYKLVDNEDDVDVSSKHRVLKFSVGYNLSL